MRFGICCSPGSFVLDGQEDTASAVGRMMEVLQDAAADYVEFSVGMVSPEGPEHAFEEFRTMLAPYPIKVEVFNCFIPPHHRVTGPGVDLESVLGYCRVALQRCKALGGEVVVLGSAGARRSPEGFDIEEARRQFIGFCRELGPVADEAGIKIAIEPLNYAEDNLINTVAQGCSTACAVNHPSIQVLADLHHISQNRESFSGIEEAGQRLIHTHCADLEREAPGFGPPGQDFFAFFRSLYQAGYEGRCSFEGKLDDIAARAQPLITFLRKQQQHAYLPICRPLPPAVEPGQI